MLSSVWSPRERCETSDKNNKVGGDASQRLRWNHKRGVDRI